MIFFIFYFIPAYDLHFILDYVHQRCIKPSIIQNGKKILCMEVEEIKFIDSLNFFPKMSLASLPKAFGLDELCKGYFPHLFNKAENQSYEGPMPDIEYYDPDGMMPEKRHEFINWYNKQQRFSFQNDLRKYCISDVDILQRVCGKFRSMFMKMTQNIDPFVNAITIASACNEVYRKLFLEKDQVAIIPPQGYNVQDVQSGIALCWLDHVSETDNVTIQHAGNGREVTIEGYKIDGIDENGVLYEFHGDFWHGCPSCYPDRNTMNPVVGISMGDLYSNTICKVSQLESKGHKVIQMWECQFRKMIFNNPQLKLKLVQYQNHHDPLQPRDAFFGGRTNATCLFYEAQANEEIRYLDFTSLYPYCCKYCQFPIGHPEILRGGDIPDHVQGLLKCKVLPPKQLLHPVLPCRIRKKLLFPLCYTCALNGAQEFCTHTDDERALTGTWVSVELDKARQMGYIIMEKYEAWHFKETAQYDPFSKSGGLWTDYINTFLKLKQESSGYPDYCNTDDKKQKYIADFLEHEGIFLDESNIAYNKCIREISKIMLNSFWGKFGQCPRKSKLTYISDPVEYIDMMTNDTLEVTDLLYVNDEFVALRWITKNEFVEPLPNTNIVLAAYTTAHARLKLYSLLEQLQERVLYFDTDSVVYIHRHNSCNPSLGDYLGELKDETNGVPITSFLGAGPKNYSYRLKNGKEVCKVRGFTLNFRSSMKLNFESMKELITTSEHVNSDDYNVDEPHKIIRKEGNLYTLPQSKHYQLVYDKRMVMEDLTTLPFGYKL